MIESGGWWETGWTGLTLRFVLLAAAAFSALGLVAAEAVQSPARPDRAPAIVELRDQYDVAHRWSFPATNVVVVTIADRDGSSQVDGWISALKERYAGKLEWRGLAQVGGIPEFWRGRIRKKFQETRRYPVLLDWTGRECAAFGYVPRVANLLVVAPDGQIQHRCSGEATTKNLATVTDAIDRLLAVKPATPASASSSDQDPNPAKSPVVSESRTTARTR